MTSLWKYFYNQIYCSKYFYDQMQWPSLFYDCAIDGEFNGCQNLWSDALALSDHAITCFILIYNEIINYMKLLWCYIN